MTEKDKKETKSGDDLYMETFLTQNKQIGFEIVHNVLTVPYIGLLGSNMLEVLVHDIAYDTSFGSPYTRSPACLGVLVSIDYKHYKVVLWKLNMDECI